MRKCAVFSCKGLGDGLISLILSHNLFVNNCKVVTYHDNHLDELQSWFSHLLIKQFPSLDDLHQMVREYDQIFVSYDRSSAILSYLTEVEKKNNPEKIFVLNPSFSPKTNQQRFYQDCCFKSNISMTENMLYFCQNKLMLPKTSLDNGIIIPKNLEHHKFLKRVIIHPTSGNPNKNWSLNKFIQVAHRLKIKGFDPCFIMSPKEKKDKEKKMGKNFSIYSFNSLEALARFIYESGYMIGNDSGIGHLASLLSVPTITIFRNYRISQLWRPSWTYGQVAYPPKWVINIAFMRYRDRFWKELISVKKILKMFNDLYASF